MSTIETDEAERIEAAPRFVRGVVVWFAVWGGVAAWTVHLVFMASTAREACKKAAWRWSMHGATLGLSLVTIAAILLSVRLYRAGGEADDGSPTAASRIKFLGVLGIVTGGFNLALILLEGLYAAVLHHCG